MEISGEDSGRYKIPLRTADATGLQPLTAGVACAVPSAFPEISAETADATRFRWRQRNLQFCLAFHGPVRYDRQMAPLRKGKPPRLNRIFQTYDAPVFLVTFNTYRRRPLLARPELHSAFKTYCGRATEHGMAVGRYVLMPDHAHLFVCFGVAAQITLGTWNKGLKRQLDRVLYSLGEEPAVRSGEKLRSFWQPGFHDHLLRTNESYAQKWAYVKDNPVRAGLVTDAADWSYAGEITTIDRV